MRVAGTVAVTVDGFPVDCSLEETVRTGATAEISVAGAGELEVTLGDADITGELGGAPLAASVSVAPDTLTQLRVVSRAGGASYLCTVRLVYRAALEAGIERLRGESAGVVSYTESDETGAPANMTLRVGTTGATPSEQAADFLSRHAGALGVGDEQLVELEAEVAPDGFAVVRFEQRVETVLAYRAGLDLEIDPDGIVVSLHARLFVGVTEAPAFTSTEAAVRAAAAEDSGEVFEVIQVVFDPARPRAAWHVVGALADVVVEDGSLEIVQSIPTVDPATVEIHRPTPTPLPGSSRASLTGHTLVASGPSTGSAPTTLVAAERRVWGWAATIAENVRQHQGQNGWSARTFRTVNISQVPANTVRFMLEPRSVTPGAGWYSYGMVYLGTTSTTEQAVVCHEYGHAIHDTLRRNAAEARVIKESLADVFWVFCDPWVSGRRNSGYRGQNFASPSASEASYSYDYNAFLAAGLTADNVCPSGSATCAMGYDVHDFTFLLSTPFYRMVESYHTPTDRGEQLAYFALSYNRSSRVERFRAFRDAIVQQADSWARSGRHGFTPKDACNVATAFRDAGLDGEYGTGTGGMCGDGMGSSRGSGDRYVCTTAYCPLCPIELENPCAEIPTASEPHCVAPGVAGGEDRRICVGALVVTNIECAAGGYHHCSCGADGSWTCPEPCRDLSGSLIYCPEDGGDGMGQPRNPTCSIGIAAPRRSLALWGAVLAMVIGWRTRRRRRG